MFKAVKNTVLSIHNWAQYFLKFILSHPSITGDFQSQSLATDIQAGNELLPDEKTRKKRLEYFNEVI